MPRDYLIIILVVIALVAGLLIGRSMNVENQEDAEPEKTEQSSKKKAKKKKKSRDPRANLSKEDKKLYDRLLNKGLHCSWDYYKADGEAMYWIIYFGPERHLIKAISDLRGDPNHQGAVKEIWAGTWEIEDGAVHIQYSPKMKFHGKYRSALSYKIPTYMFDNLDKYKYEISAMQLDVDGEQIARDCMNYGEISLKLEKYVDVYPTEKHTAPPCFCSKPRYSFLHLKRLTKADLKDYTHYQLRLMRNQIFACYGYDFEDSSLFDNYYEFEKSSYITMAERRAIDRHCGLYPQTQSEVSSVLSPIEIHNVQTILQAEKSHDSRPSR